MSRQRLVEVTSTWTWQLRREESNKIRRERSDATRKAFAACEAIMRLLLLQAFDIEAQSPHPRGFSHVVRSRGHIVEDGSPHRHVFGTVSDVVIYVPSNCRIDVRLGKLPFIILGEHGEIGWRN